MTPFLALACVGVAPDGAGSDYAGASQAWARPLASSPAQTGGPRAASPQVSHEVVPGASVVDDCSDVFDDDLLATFEVSIDEAEWALIVAEFEAKDGTKPWHPAVVTYGGEVYDLATLRLKGNEGYSWIGDKMQFVIGFDEVDPDGRFHGLREVGFDATWYDPSLLRQRLASQFLREAGVHGPCGNHARLDVNGSYYGVYALVEDPDHEYLERIFGDEDADGLLYKYGWDLKTDEDEGPDTTKMQLFWEATDVAAMEEVGDVAQWVREWAAEAVIMDGDGYWCCAHNFYTYDHPDQDLLWLPWDLDASFGWTGNAWSDPLYHPFLLWEGAHYRVAMADPAWRAAFIDELRDLRDGLDPTLWEYRTDFVSEQIATSVHEDTRKPYTDAEHVADVAAVRTFFGDRAAFLDDWLACRDGMGTHDSDGDGAPWCDDCNDGAADVYPGAPETCDGVDDDCDGDIDDDPSCHDCLPLGDGLTLCTWPVAFAEAPARCAAAGGTLFVPRTTEQHTEAVERMTDLWLSTWIAYSGWVGVGDVVAEGVWADLEGDLVGPIGFLTGYPNGGDAQDCVLVDSALWWWWNDRACTDRHPVICTVP